MNFLVHYEVGLKVMRLHILLILLVLFSQSSCFNTNTVNKDVKAISVDSSLFLEKSLLKEIVQEDCTLSNGTQTKCYKITVKAEPQEHKMGPWCPDNIKDDKEKGGIWFKDGKVYDVDGKFVANLDEFYSDPKWELYREDGSIKVTKSQEACEAAARPDVDEKYQNHCVQCSPTFYEGKKIIYRIPVTPVAMNETTELTRDGIGLAFNGVGFDPPAPLHAILDAHTLAPLDDCGGHVNPHKGYHYHATKGCTKESTQEAEHSPLLGYALDGFGIYARKNKKGKEITELDKCGGHSDDKLGYHYHAGKPGDNQIISCFRGDPGSIEMGK